MLLFCLFMFQAISVSYGMLNMADHDLDLKGIEKIGNELRTVSDQSEFVRKLLPLSFSSKGKLPKKVLSSAGKRAATDMDMNNNKKPESLQQFINYLHKKGIKTLTYIAKQILSDLNINTNISELLQMANDNYISMMQEYYDFINADQNDISINNDSIYLDIVETSNRLLYSEKRMILTAITLDQNLTAINKKMKTINEKIFKHHVNERNEDIKYVCSKYGYCREYPAFIEFCADVISEVMKLSKEKIRRFFKILVGILQNNDVFLATVSEKEDRELIIAKLQTLSTNLIDMKEFFAILSAAITERLRPVPTECDEFKLKTKSIKILLDIIDKALSTEEDLLTLDYDTSMSALKNWAAGMREEIDDIYENVAKNLLRILEYNLTQNAKKEIRVLVKTIIRGTAEDDKVYQDLLKFGSKYVAGEDLPSDMNILSV